MGHRVGIDMESQDSRNLFQINKMYGIENVNSSTM